MARYDCVESCLSRAFYAYGKFAYRHRLLVLLSSLTLLILCGTGYHRLEMSENVSKLFSPDNSKSLSDLEVLMAHFPAGNDSREFLPNRELTFTRRARFIVTAPDGGNIMGIDSMREIVELDERVRSLNVQDDETIGKTDSQSLADSNSAAETYETICMRWLGVCVDNAWLRYISRGIRHHGILLNLTYPFVTVGNQELSLGGSFSGVETYPGTDVIREVKAIRLTYSLSGEDEIAARWEDLVEEKFDVLLEGFNSIKLSRTTSMSLSKETAEAGLYAMPRFVVTFLLMVIFSFISCFMRDWVLSKPWLGFLGVVSACLAIISAVGLMSYVTKFNVFVALMPFVVLGVGLDNMFIFISAWRQLNPSLSVEERVGQTLSKAAVSVTITNLTDVLAFIVGATTRLQSIRVFCGYAGVAMIFVYVYQMTFYVACLSYLGEREAQNRHCFTCQKVRKRGERGGKLYETFCAGGVSENNAFNDTHSSEHPLAKFFRLIYGPFIVRPGVKLFIFLGFLAYLGGAVFGCTRVTTEMKFQTVTRDNSPAWVYYGEEEKYFTEYGPTVSVVFEGPVSYWEDATQRRLLEIQERFTRNEFIFEDARLTWSWLPAFERYAQLSEGGHSMNESEFYVKLGEFIEDPRFSQYKLDLDLVRDADDTITDVLASRFVITARNMSSTGRGSDMMLRMRELAEEESDYSITAFSFVFIVYEQLVGVIPVTFKTLALAIACMFTIAVLMIPHPICAVFVTLCIVSIDTAVIGYMSLWGVPLNPISLVNIILCIGFSVDFAAHISYGYVVAPEKDPNLRTVSALGMLGMPILQGALSTIIAISVLSTASVYLFRIFFKTLFLVMLFGAVHGLLFLPVCLSLVGRWMPHKTVERGHQIAGTGVVLPRTDGGYHPVASYKPDSNIKGQLFVVEMVSTV